MDYKKLNKMAFDRALKAVDGKDTPMMWAEDPHDENCVYLLSNYAAYRIHKALLVVQLKDEPMSDESIRGILSHEELKVVTPTGNERKHDKDTLIELTFEDGTLMYINKKFYAPFDSFGYQMMARDHYHAVFMFGRDNNDIAGLIMPVRLA